MRKIFSALLASAYLTFAPLAAVADEAETKAQVAEISARLVERLPMDQKMVLKALSPEQSGLPEDFLRKLTSDLEAALLVASEFNINLVNRLSTEELWSEATEFGDADFEKLYAASQADIMLMLTPRATGAGVEISLTAYRLLGDDAGQVIASSGSILLAMDMENNIGVDVNSLNDQMALILQEIERVGQTGGLISDANTYAEYYHNARLLQQRGEIDLAINNYEAALEVTPFPFVDPVEDLVGLAEVKYGKDLNVYIENKLSKILSTDLYAYAVWLSNPKSTSISAENLSPDGDVFLPLVFVWLEQNKKILEEKIRSADARAAPDYESLFLLLEASRKYLAALRTGELQNYYIDKLRASASISQSELRNLIEEFSFAAYSFFETDYEYGSGEKYLDLDCPTIPCEKDIDHQGIPGYVFETGMMGIMIRKNSGEIRGLGNKTIKNDELSRMFPQVSVGDLEDFYMPAIERLSKSSSGRLEYFEQKANLGPCGAPLERGKKFTNSFIRVPTFDNADVAEERQNGDYQTESRIAPYQPLLFADTCIDLWRNSSEPIVDEKFPSNTDDIVATSKEYTLSSGLKLTENAWRSNNLSLSANFKINSYVPNHNVFNEFTDDLFKIHGLQGLLITDNVDTTKPVVLTYGIAEYLGGQMNKLLLGSIDLTKDGSFIDAAGMPFNPNWAELYGPPSIKVKTNSWFYIPGVVQGSLGLDRPFMIGVKYSDLSGSEKFISSFKREEPYGEFFPYAAPGYLASQLCQDNADPFFYVHSANNECLKEDVGIQLSSDMGCDFEINSCIKGPSFPRAASFSAIRHALFHSLDLFDITTASLSAEVKVPDGLEDVALLTKSFFLSVSLDGRQTIQEILAQHFDYEGQLDGKWGQETEAAVVRMFQWYTSYVDDQLPSDYQQLLEVITLVREKPL